MTAAAWARPFGGLRELQKLSAFTRRDFLFAWSYRTAFFSDWVGLGVQAVLLSFVGRLAKDSAVPSYNGHQASYMAFAMIGVAIGVFLQLGLDQIASGMRQEQLMGTLEPLLLTPTAPSIVQIGSAVYQLLYVPFRTIVFLAIVDLVYGLDFKASGILPSLVIVAAFVPVVWGIGIAGGAATLTFRRGLPFGIAGVLLTFGSGAYFPLGLFPSWVATLAKANPVAIALEGVRSALIGGAGWSAIGSHVLLLVPMAFISVSIGVVAFRKALNRELRLGTLGLY
jgi:ABC-type polysaccharide/polyol phosphate export permease